MGDVSPSFVPKLAQKARLRFDRHSNSYMIVYPERGLALNDSAAAIAKRCDGTLSIEEIAVVLAREANDTDLAQVTHDVVRFVEELARKGLLEP